MADEKSSQHNVVDLASKPKNKVQALEVVQALSELLPRARLMARLGQQYSGDRDVYEALGYDTDLDYDDYAARYERQDIATAIIDRPVDATWRGGVKVVESNDTNETVFEKAWKDLYKRLKLNLVFPRLDKLTGIGSYGVLFLGLDDAKKREDLMEPVAGGKRKLLYVKPLSEGCAEVNEWERRTGEPRFGLPVNYNITIKDPGTDMGTQIKVHYTRIIHITDKLLESEVEGTPRLKSVFNRLVDLEKLVGGSAEMFWRGARPGYQFVVDEDAAGVDTSSLQDTFDELEHHLRRILINVGGKYEALEQQIADPSKQVAVQFKMIAAITGIPIRILDGSERGELASTQDDDMWNVLIQGRRNGIGEWGIVRPFVDTCISYQILPVPINEYSVIWEDLWSPSAEAKAQIGRTRAIALANYDRASLSRDIVPPEAFDRFLLGLEDKDIEMLRGIREAYMKELKLKEEQPVENQPTDQNNEEVK